MSNQDIAFHYVCTLDEARQLIDSRERFWVSNCGCREGRNGCRRSRIDVCLIFSHEDGDSGGSDRREITREQVEDILREAETKNLVSRPFRDEKNMAEVGGICFCCDDCCGYFLDPTDICDRGELVESTNLEVCNDCGECVDVCYFLARTVADGELTLDRDYCYGCGLCVSACPEGGIKMVKREKIRLAKSPAAGINLV